MEPSSFLTWPARALWHVPGSFRLAALLGRHYGLRCVVFHDIADKSSPFTHGLSIPLTPQAFEERIRFLATHYTPVSLEAVLAVSKGATLPPRPVLVTFDDAYASVAEFGMPICRKYDVPAVFFVNAAFIGNQDLSLDNLLCYVANQIGIAPIQAAVREMAGQESAAIASVSQVIHDVVPHLSLDQRTQFQVTLANRAGIRSRDLAFKANLYLTERQLRHLCNNQFDIGNHTYSHVRCRILTGADFDREIGRNKHELERVSRQSVRAFSVPFGSRVDLTPQVLGYLRESGHEAAFLVDSLANTATTSRYGLYRVSMNSTTDAASFAELEVLPRLRAIREELSTSVP